MRLMFASLLLILPAPALAQMADLVKCAAIARDAERLACYDAAVADSSPQARAASEVRAKETAKIVAAEAAAAALAKREAFGAEGVKSRPDRFKLDANEVQTVESSVTEMLTNRSGLAVFLLENGQLWRQADTVNLPNVRPGDTVKIDRAALGGYNLTLVKQKRVVLVKRVR